MEKVDVVVIGAGPAGYPAAIRAAQLGKSVVIVDKGSIGGECLNWGCIPSKALISASKFYYKMVHEAEKMGIKVEKVSVDIPKMMEWKEGIQNKLIEGIKQMLKLNKVRLVIGEAGFVDTHTIKVDGEEIAFEHAIITTGSSFISLPGFAIDEDRILSAKGALSLKEVPEELIVIGGGIIGLELGTAWAKLGSKVKVVELLPQLMTGVDKRLVTEVKKKLKKLGVEVYTKAKASKYEIVDEKIVLDVETKKGSVQLTGDKILLSIGKRASTGNIGLPELGIEMDKGGFIKVDEQLRTSVPHIYAAGDCVGMPFLAHKSTKQGIIAAEVIGGLDSAYNPKAMPGAIFTDPEIGTVGITMDEAKEKGIKLVVGQAPFAGSGRAMAELEDVGIARILSDAETGKILGVEIVGPHASDLISEGALAVEKGLTAAEFGHTIHPHPTLPEMLMEAAESIEGKAIHVPNARR